MPQIRKEEYISTSILSVVVATTTVVGFFLLLRLLFYSDWKDMAIALPYFILYCAIVWAVFVLPFVILAPKNPLVSGPMLAWLTWAVAAICGFLAITVPLWGKPSVQAVIFVAVIGALAGFIFSIAVKRRQEHSSQNIIGRL